jgi:hypothetical protein
MPNPAGFVALCGGCAEVMNWTRLSSAHQRHISSTVLQPATSLAVCPLAHKQLCCTFLWGTADLNKLFVCAVVNCAVVKITRMLRMVEAPSQVCC